MRIARKLRTDKRSKMRVKADVLATKVILQIDNLSLKLSHVEARRVATTLEKAVNIQLTHREKTISSSSSTQQVLVEPEQKEELPVLTTLDRRLEICRYIYQVIKEKHQDIPKYKVSKINPFRAEKTCNSTSLGHAFAHCHNQSRGKYKYRICIKQKMLLNPLYRQQPRYPIQGTNLNDVYENLADMMSHEMAHLKITRCSHCKKWRARYEQLHKTIITSIRNGEFFKNMPDNLKESKT